MAGKITEFDVVAGNWEAYCERLEMSFLVNDVKESLKVPTLIACVGESAYELMVNLCSPSKPKDKTYADLVALVKEHLQPKPAILAERFRFRQCRQRSDQNVALFVAELKKLARYCEFAKTLDENMRDQFVCGLASDATRQRLFAEDTVDFTKAVQIATTIEAAERDARAVEPGKMAAGGGGGPPGCSEVHHLRAAPCKACGDHRHPHWDCKFRLFECSRCRKVGHLRRMCPMGLEQGGQAGGGGAPGMAQQQRDWSSGARRGAGGGGGRRGGSARGGRATWQRRRGGYTGRGGPTSSYLMREEEEGQERDSDEQREEDEPVHQMSLREYKPAW
ncbi:uncharacterized protein LOC119691384 [Plutella xylostella]|uniref:uncharacterized protein LOC119691384 n=1 Tax=Plutella xylostella TaxID=51655 RepID=UPI00203222FF|nr:uncharacterized protein LOC119691384 [Plutella xylostella]